MIDRSNSKWWKRLEPFPISLASLFPVTKECAVSCTFRGNAFSPESNGGWAFRIPVLAHCTCQGQMTSFRRKDVRDGAPTISVVVIHPVDRPCFWQRLGTTAESSLNDHSPSPRFVSCFSFSFFFFSLSSFIFFFHCFSASFKKSFNVKILS